MGTGAVSGEDDNGRVRDAGFCSWLSTGGAVAGRFAPAGAASALNVTVVSSAASSRRASSIPIASCQASWSISNLRSDWFADMQVSVDFLTVNLCEKDNYRCGIRYHITDAAITMKVAQKDLVGLNGREKVRDGT